MEQDGLFDGVFDDVPGQGADDPVPQPPVEPVVPADDQVPSAPAPLDGGVIRMPDLPGPPDPGAPTDPPGSAHSTPTAPSRSHVSASGDPGGAPVDLSGAGPGLPGDDSVGADTVDLDGDVQLDGVVDLDGAGDPAADLTGPPADLGDPSVAYQVNAGNSWLAPTLVAAAAAAMGLAIPVALSRRRAPRDIATQLDLLGIDARVEHCDLTDLTEILDGGGSVLLSTDGTAGTDGESVLQVRRLDRDLGRLTVSDEARRTYDVALERFEAAWADTAQQVVVANGPEDDVALVPVVLDRRDLVATN